MHDPTFLRDLDEILNRSQEHDRTDRVVTLVKNSASLDQILPDRDSVLRYLKENVEDSDVWDTFFAGFDCAKLMAWGKVPFGDVLDYVKDESCTSRFNEDILEEKNILICE